MENLNFQKGIARITVVIFLAVILVGGIFAWQNWFGKISPEKLGEFAFIQGGDIWTTNEDFESKYKVIDTKEAIKEFAISPDGKETYWLNEKKEIWKRDYRGIIKPLISIGKDMEEVTVEKGILDGKTSYLKGEVADFSLSPDGKFIAYMRLEELISACCAATYKVPTDWAWIMKNDGSEKTKIEKPSVEKREIMSFDKWLPDSKKILFHFRYGDEVTIGSSFYEVGLDGKNPKVSLLNSYDEEFVNVLDTEPFFSPDGTKAIYFTSKQGKPGIWLMNIDGSNKKQILEGKFWEGSGVRRHLSWSEDGTLLAVSTDREIFIFDRQGNLISKLEIIKPGVGGKWDWVSNLIISSDKKYLVGQYEIDGEKFATPFSVDLLTKEIKKFQYPKLENISTGYDYYIYNPKFLSKKGNLYYLISPTKLPDQFWVLNINSGKNSKIMENALQITKIR